MSYLGDRKLVRAKYSKGMSGNSELKAIDSNFVAYSIWFQPIPCRMASIAT